MASTNMTTVTRLQDELRASKEELSTVTEQIKDLSQRKSELSNKIVDIKKQLEMLNQSENSLSHYERGDFPWSQEMVGKMKNVFGIEGFRSHQKAAINATMSGADVILIMPTGGGKSLCFQLPAVLSEGVTLVISPLISLMEDQLQGLQQVGVATEIFNAQTDKEGTKRIFTQMTDPKGTLRMLYVTPEKLAKSKRLMANLEKMYRFGRFARLVIDEVHCCSQWGHDFRPDYKFLGIMKTQYPKTPIIGLTATATTNVIVDIQKILNIEGCLVLRDSFYRPNLRYSVTDSLAKEKVEELGTLIKKRFPGMSGIVYCLTVKDCEEVAKKLSENGIRSACYHSQLEPEWRSNVQRKWCENKIQVIVATVAFGMGINKLDVRFVIHYSMSKSLENYYQETGRAGRDGADADCILLFSFPDSFRASSIMMTERNGIQNVYNMLRYALDQRQCRKQQLAAHFGDPCDIIKDGCKKCDNCEFARNPVNLKEVTIHAKDLLKDILKLLKHADDIEERMTALKLMDAWFNKGIPKLRVADVAVPKYSREICEKLVSSLLIRGFLKEDFHFTPYSTISYIVPATKSFDLNSHQSQLTFTFLFVRNNSSNKLVPMQKKSSSTKRKAVISDDSDDDEDFKPSPNGKKARSSKSHSNLAINGADHLLITLD